MNPIVRFVGDNWSWLWPTAWIVFVALSVWSYLKPGRV